VLAEVLCLTADHMAYTSDTVYLPSEREKRGGGKFVKALIESFDYARVRLGGDCEDLALEILLCLSELLRRREEGSPMVRELSLLAGAYVFAMALGGVSSAEINGDFGKLKSMGAHMWTVAVLKSLFRRWWARGNGGGRENRLLPLLEADTVSEDGLPPVLVLEGTGFLREELSEEDARFEDDARDVLGEASQRGSRASKAFAGLRKVFRYRRGRRNTFYQTVSILLTNHFLLRKDGGCHVCFAVCRAPPLTFGAEFADVTRGSPLLALWSEPEMDAGEVDCVRDCLKDAHPMPGHEPPTRAEPLEPEVEARLSGLAGEFPAPLGKDDASVFSVDFFADHRVLTEEKAEALRETCHTALGNGGGCFLGLRYHKEHVRDGLLGYRIEFLFRRDRASLTRSAVEARRRLAIRKAERQAQGSGEDEEEE